jgi:glucose/arabinose dehydrogenase
MQWRSLVMGMCLAALAACSRADVAPTPPDAQGLRLRTVASGLANPWGLAFLPDGRMLVTERSGQLRLIGRDGQPSQPIDGVPEVDAKGQGGLLDVAVDPQFTENGFVYLSYAEKGDPSHTPPSSAEVNGTAVARGKLVGNRLESTTVIFRQQPKVRGSAHFGSRLVFARDGRLFITLGDRFAHRDQAQNLENHFGKVIRIESDGRVPKDNPFVSTPSARPEIWSYGHRNMQGAALHPGTGELWTNEHGPQGGDEINLDLPGRNYGWPVITYGAEYGSGKAIGESTAKTGMEQPQHHWVPSIATSGMAFLTSERYPGWKGDVFVGGLAGKTLVRLSLDGNKVTGEQRLLSDLKERIRAVVQGPDGWLYVLTDHPKGRVLRVER